MQYDSPLRFLIIYLVQKHTCQLSILLHINLLAMRYKINKIKANVLLEHD
jgi:hypothetical protein